MSDRGSVPAPTDAPVTGDQPTLLGPEAGGTGSGARPAHGGGGDWTGREVAGRYVIRERLGEGGMGVVYVAEHMHLKRKVAFKVIHPDLAQHESLLLRFEREALATGQLDHPHIAAAIDFGQLEGGGAFMVMPLVRGHSLQRELDVNGAFEPRRAALLGAQIADALSAAHAVGIIHRDLKPDNVLVEQRSDGSEAAKVLDFGVASMTGIGANLSVGARPLTQAGTILGTPGYMSPEQATAGEIDHRTDLYALGVILWELCQNARLFDGDNVTQIFARQFNAQPPALSIGFTPQARALSELVTQLLAWDKNARPGSAVEVRDALRRIAELPEPRLPASVTSLRRYVPSLSGFFEGRQRRRTVAGVVLAIVLGLVLALVARDDDDSAGLSAESPASSSEAARERENDKLAEKPAQSELKGDALKAELQQAQDALLGRDRAARQDAAKRVLRRGDDAPRYLQLMADLELASGCAARKQVLADMRARFDPRVLPALDRLAAQPRRGCGLFKASDCLACLRRELEQTIGALEQVKSR